MGLVNNATVLLKNGADIIGTGIVTNNAAGTITKPDGGGTNSEVTPAGVENDGLIDDQVGDLSIAASDATGASTVSSPLVRARCSRSAV